MNNNRYDKVKILYKLCRLHWFIEKFAMQDALQVNDAEALEDLKKLKFDLQQHIDRFKKGVFDK